MNKLIKITIILIILGMVYYSGSLDINNFRENKKICKDNNGEWVKHNLIHQSNCLIDGELYKIVETNKNKHLIKK